MSSSRNQALQQALGWPLRYRTTTAVLAASGLFLILFTVSRRIWRGGGKKPRDPGGTSSSVKVKEKLLPNSCCQKEDKPNQRKKEEVQPECRLKGITEEVVRPPTVEEAKGKGLPLNKEVIEENLSGKTLELEGTGGCNPTPVEKKPAIVKLEASKLEDSLSDSVFEVSGNCSAQSIDPITRKEKVIVAGEYKDPLICEPKEITSRPYPESCETQAQILESVSFVDIRGGDQLAIQSKHRECAQERLVLASPLESKEIEEFIPEEVGVLVSEEVVSTSVLGHRETPNKVVLEVGESGGEASGGGPLSAPQNKAIVNAENSVVEEKIEAIAIKSVACEVLTEELKKEVLPTVGDTELEEVKDSAGEVVEEVSGSSEVTLGPIETKEGMTKGVETDLELVGSKTGSKRKGKKEKRESDGVEERMEVKEVVMDAEESVLQDDENDIVEEHANKCRVPSGHMDASSLGSPSMSNFPDNRSEGSSCGDSGKGRSDVTTPGGLDEELREVNFSHHYSPPCSSSGPDEEEEGGEATAVKEADSEEGGVGSSRGDGDLETEEEGGMMENGPVMPVTMPIYHGMVPVTPPSVYEFVIPQGLVGRLIGKHGSFVNLIKARTSATIFIKTHPETNKLKVCAVEGADDEIQAALAMIREKFPQQRYSSMTLEQVFFLPLPPPTFTLMPDSLHVITPLNLVEGVSNDVILSALVSPSHYFLQQPTHPTYPTLAKLDMWMAMCYQDANAPLLPENVEPGIICVAPTMGGWYRAQIVAVEELASEDESAEEGELVKWCDVRFVDYGGYERLPAQSLRQIRSDFMTLPFQSSECYLAHVVPAPTSDENKVADGWSMEAYALVEELTQAQVLKALVVGHAPDGLPLVLLYAFSHSYGQVVRVNDELVNRGMAVWAMPMVEADEVGIVSGEDASTDCLVENQPDETASA